MPAATPQVALVTGASRGIGRAVAVHAARRFDVIATARSAEELQSLANEIGAAGGHCETIVLDVTDAHAVERALAGRRVDVLVNNAGMGVLKPFLELTADDWRRTMATNVDSLFHVTRAVLPGMVERRSGHVITIGSIAGRNGFVGGSCYSATKHAVMGFTESLMLEVRDFGVKVSVVMPGSVNTHFSQMGKGAEWKLTSDDVAATVMHVIDTPPNVLVHRVEVRPLTPPKKG